MNKKISLGLALSLIAVSIAVTFILTSFFSLQSFNEKVADVNEKAKKYSDLQEIDTIVRNDYFGEINEQYLEDEMLKGYVSGLDDKYSRYLTAEEYLSEKNENSGTLVGLGIVVEEDESGYIRIADIYNSSPASDSGLMEDDLIITVDGINTKKIGTDEALNLIKGTEGSDVSMTIRRNGVDTEYKFTRRAVTLDTVESEMLGNYIGYIKISGFKENTPDQFIDALERLTANGAKSLIFDLRDNGGGLVSALEKCLDPLLPEGTVATAEYKDGSVKALVQSDASELDIPMSGIGHENNASAAELFSASLRDFGKASLVGSQTYGKGVMQDIREFSNGTALILTVAEYKTAFSPCYNGIGLTPDYPVENEEDGIDAQYNKAVEILLAF
ncbi:MAG: PDZ domain-containing protein [Ruminococcus sp.]|nr:PDZ domain-containing protein [Ruminococcus sp.]